jgi:predicted RNA binding protein YcfA (HicA-like mRNA interferase family)
MPSLSDLPDNITRAHFCRVLKKLGFAISTKGGKGSHIKATWSATGKFITLQDDFRRDVLYHVIKEIEKHAPITWEDIKKEL